MEILRNQPCYNHSSREAVVRCPECGRYFCRECVTEHDDRMLCSQCLEQTTRPGREGSRKLIQAFLLIFQGLGGWLIVAYAFYLVGKALLAIPHDFHEGTFWKEGWLGK
jgi:hypothetical protein